MSALGEKRTLRSLGDFVGAGEQCGRHNEAKRFRGAPLSSERENEYPFA